MANHQSFAQPLHKRIKIDSAIERTKGRGTNVRTLTALADGVTLRAHSPLLERDPRLSSIDHNRLPLVLCSKRDNMTALLTSKGQQFRMRPETGHRTFKFHGAPAQFAAERDKRGLG